MGVGGRVVRRRAEDRQAHAADRAGDATAVDDQILEALVGGTAHVHAYSFDQIAERRGWQREALAGVCQRDDHEIRAVAWQRLGAAAQTGERERLGVEPAQLLRALQAAVADIVDAPGERVHRAHRAAPVMRK